MQFSLKPIAAALTFAAMGGISMDAQAIEVAAGDLETALSGLANETGIQILFDANALKGARTTGARGAATAGDALTQVLQGSGYVFKQAGRNSFVVQRQYVAKTAEREAFQALDPITVTATRTERKVSEVPASVSVVTAKTIAVENRQNVTEVLRDVEGLDFNEVPSVAYQIFPYIRGAGTSNVGGGTTQVLVNGMPNDTLVSNVLGRGGLNFTSLQDIERVEVVRGSASALYGISSIGGVVNVIPKRWKGEAGVELNTSYGAHNTQKIGAAVGTAKENFDVRLSVYDAKSDGFITRPVNNGFGQIDLAPKDWRDKKVALMAGFRPADDHEITLNLQDFVTSSATNGGRPNSRLDLGGQAVTLGYRYDMSNTTNLKADIRVDNLKMKTLTDVYPTLKLASIFDRASTSTLFNVQLNTTPFDANRLSIGYSHGTSNQNNVTTTVATKVTVSQGLKDSEDALFVQDEQGFGSFSITGGLRYDRLNFAPDTLNGIPRNNKSSADNVISPRVGARYKLSDSTSFYASAGTGYLPALNQFKFPWLATQVANPNLKPETSVSREVGMNNQYAWGVMRTSLFSIDYKDKITVGTDPISLKQQFQNIAVRKSSGLEFALQADLGRGWHPYANFSYTKALDQAAAGAAFTKAFLVAPRKLNAGVTYEAGDDWYAALNVRAVSSSNFSGIPPLGGQKIAGYVNADAKIGIKLGVGWDAFLAVNNLTDAQYQTSSLGMWSDRRTFTVGIGGKL